VAAQGKHFFVPTALKEYEVLTDREDDVHTIKALVGGQPDKPHSFAYGLLSP
jgi:hypothetical protein